MSGARPPVFQMMLEDGATTYDGTEHRVVLVERERDHLFAPSLLWLMVGDRRREQVTRPLRGLLDLEVELVHGAVTRIDPERKAVLVGERELGCDALVVALGTELAPETFPGYAEAAHDFFDLVGAARLADALRAYPGGRTVVAVTKLPYKCPAAPYEAALLIEDALRRRGVRGRSEARASASTCSPRCRRTGRPASCGARRSPNESGWIPVDAHTLRTPFEGVYAVGDATTIALANGKPLPKAGVFAHAEARVVARQIAASFGGAPTTTFDETGYCWVELGGGRAAFAEGDFYATPATTIRLRAPGALWHLGKVLFERSWMGAGLERALAVAALRIGARATGVETPI